MAIVAHGLNMSRSLNFSQFKSGSLGMLLMHLGPYKTITSEGVLEITSKESLDERALIGPGQSRLCFSREINSNFGLFLDIRYKKSSFRAS